MEEPEDDLHARRMALCEAIEISRDNFQKALDLADKDPQVSADDRRAIENIVAEANKVYGKIFALQFIKGSLTDVAIKSPLKLRKQTAPKTH
jgi:hypothetical protein